MASDAKNGNHKIEESPVETPEMPTDPASFELRILDAKRMKVFRQAGVARMTLRDDRSWIKVSVARSFPLSDPDHYLGFLDGAGKDVGLLIDPGLLDPESRKVVDEEL